VPKILERLVSQLKAKGYSESASRAIAVSSLQKSGNLKKGSEEPTAKGIRRGNMTPEQRAKDRASKYSTTGRKPDEFKYDPKTNRTKLK
jgi:hypothetical protein